MSRKIETRSFDDLTGEPAHTSVSFGYSGQWFEIDLTATNAEKITALLTEWSDHGRARTAPAPMPSTRRTASDRARAAAIRQWASKNGLVVAVRGRISDQILRAYEQSLDPNVHHQHAGAP